MSDAQIEVNGLKLQNQQRNQIGHFYYSPETPDGNKCRDEVSKQIKRTGTQ